MGNKRYRIIKSLKKGGISDVFLAFDYLKRRKCIVKLLNTEVVSDEEIIKRFKREAKILKKLRHKNIVRFYDFVKFDYSFGIIIEFVEGDSLKNLMKENRIEDDMRIFIMFEILKGVHYLHKKGIIHRDLKPSNILISNKGEVKISDFGLSLSIEETRITGSGEVIGTPSYIAPEIFEGKKYSFQSDIFSLGVIFYELFSGENPFSAETVVETMSRVVTKKQKSLYSAGFADEHLSQVIDRMLEKKPEKRFRTIDEILKEITIYEERALKGKYKIKEKVHLRTQDRKFSVIPYVLSLFLVFLFSGYKKTASSGFSENKERKVSDVITPKINRNEEYTEPVIRKNIVLKKIRKDVPEFNKGYLKVNVYPWAHVFIDETVKITTPYSDLIELKPGIHRVLVKNPDFPEIEKSIKISSGETLTLNINLKKEISYLNINITPWAEVNVDKEKILYTPLAEPVEVKPGSLRLIIRNPYFYEIDTMLFVPKGETLNFTYEFKDGKNLHKRNE